MSDIDIDLLDAIGELLATETATGGSLAEIRTYFIKYSDFDTPPEWGVRPPMLLVDMLDISAESVSIPPCMMRKQYTVRFRVFTENARKRGGPRAAYLVNLIEDVFFQQMFGLAQQVDVTSKDKTVLTDSTFQTPVSGGATLILTYTNNETRSIPTQIT